MQGYLEILMFFEIYKLFDSNCCNSLKLSLTTVINYCSFTITRLYYINKTLVETSQSFFSVSVTLLNLSGKRLDKKVP